MTEPTAEGSEQSPSTRPVHTCCPIVELRQYTLHPGKRDVLIVLFDREFVESQEAVGMRIIGQFRDLDNPNRFVWLRGFRDMPSRAQALKDFYGGPVWKPHREAANATMVDSDDVLLLRRALPTSGFSLETATAPRLAPTKPPGGWSWPASTRLILSHLDQVVGGLEVEARPPGLALQGGFIPADPLPR
ncbi:MAG: NIPSNAP family protein [Gemmatimonadetes bacterium]|nr:NIPSNAP family protein [Gemmatimonadota bacterium]